MYISQQKLEQILQEIFEDFLWCQNYWMQYFLTHWFDMSIPESKKKLFPFVSISNFPKNAT